MIPEESVEEDARKGPRRAGLELRDAFYVLGLVSLVVVIMVFAAQQLAPIALAVLIWFLINAIANGLRHAPILKHVLPMSLALFIASAITLGAMFLAGRLVVANLAELSEGFVGFDQKAAEAIHTVEQTIGVSLDLNIQSILQDLRVQQYLGEIVSAFTSTASYIVLVLMFVLFLLMDQPYYDAKIRALFPNQERYGQVREVLAQIGRDTRVYIWLMTVVSIVVGGATYAICIYFGVKGAAFWGFLAFALNYIPTIGSILGVIFPTLFSLVQFDTPELIFAFAASLGVVQFVMGNLVLPRLTGERLNLSEFVVILSLTVWGTIWGVSGMFLAVPLMMVLAIVLAQFDSTRAVAILMSKNGKVIRR